MTMRAPVSDLPIMFAAAAILAGGVAILDDISLSIGPGTPTVLIGPKGSGKTTPLRAAMGLIPVSRGRVTWGSKACSTGRRGGFPVASSSGSRSPAR
jgi:tungstate transport system ATP-binding protein